MRAECLVRWLRWLLTIPVLGICGCLYSGSADVIATLEESIVDPRPPSGWPGDTPGITEAGRFYFAGQPGEAGLRHAASMQVSIVVDLRTEPEVAEGPFDEEALVTRLGMKYVSIPVTPSSFCLKDVERFGQLVKQRRSGCDDPSPECLILIHDDTSDRAGAMWAALLHGWTYRNLDSSIKSGMDAGLQSEEMIEALRRVSPALMSRQRGRADWPVVWIGQDSNHSFP